MDDNQTANRKTAALVFRRIIRNPKLRPIFGDNPAKALVCLESDEIGTMLDTLDRHYPDGAKVAIYYPTEQCFRFMTWTPGQQSGKSLPVAQKTTVGMAVAAIKAERTRWTDRVQEVSTADIERELSLA